MSKINKGDLLYWSTDGGLTYTHATIISDILDDDVLYTGHTNNRLDASLKDALSRYQVAIVHLNDYVPRGGIDE